MKTQFKATGRPSRLAGALSISAMLLISNTMHAQVTLTFDTDTQGFVQGTVGTSVAWSAEYGGSLAYTVPNGYVQNGTSLNLLSGNAELAQEFQNAMAGGGSLSFTARVKQSGIQGNNPNWFEGFVVANSDGTFDGHFGAVQGVYNVGGFPLSADFETIVTMPIAGVAANGQGPATAGILEFNTASGFFEIWLGLNSGNNTAGELYSGATIYIDNLTITGTPPPQPPSVGFYTFDEDRQGFVNDGTNASPLVHSPNYGGTLSYTSPAFPPAPASSFMWNVRRNGHQGNQLAKLRDVAMRGGFVSYDLIAPPGILASAGILTAMQAHGPWDWNQAEYTIPPGDVQTLPDGNQIARLNIPASSFSQGSILVGPNYNMWVGLSGGETPTTFHLDNVLFLPYPAEGGRLTFDALSELQNFTAEPSAMVLASNQDDLILQNPSGSVLGAKAVFNGNSTDTQVVAAHEALREVATKGGVLRVRVKSAALANRVNGFTGMNLTVAYQEGGDLQQQSLFVNQSAFTEGGDPDSNPVILNNQTPATFSRVVIIPLHPAGSTASNGFVIPEGVKGTDYTFLIGTGADNVDSVSIVFDDFEIVPNADPEVVHTPTLPPGSSSIVGRVISNAQNYAVFSATGLPPGVTLDPATGLLSGTPTVDGTYSVTFSVSHDGVTDTSESVNWIISGAGGVIPSPQIVSFTMAGANAVIIWTGTGSDPVRVLRSQTLAAEGWTEIDSGNTSGTFTDDKVPTGAAFYRIAVP